MNRREFLKYLSGAGLGLGSSSWLVEQLWALHQEAKLPFAEGAPLERWINTVCTQCPGGCGLRVRCYEGFPVLLTGNPLSPINQGGLCPLGSAGLQVLYHPDRIRQPLKRIGERGEDRWQPISWNEAIQGLQERLQKLRQRKEPHRLVFLDGSVPGTLSAVIAQFMRAYGSPHWIRPEDPTSADLAFRLSQGGEAFLAYDLANARFILSFGFDLLEAEGAPVWQALNYGKLRTSEPQARGTLVLVAPRLSLTGVQADRWIPIRPGSEAAFALGMATILIQERLYDQEFVQQHTFGFDDWVDEKGVKHTGFKSHLLRKYAPETVSELTGVPVEDLFQVARAFGRSEAPLALAGKGSTSHTNGLYTQLAVQALNALVGAVERPGGMLRARTVPLAPLAAFEPDPIARETLEQHAEGSPPHSMGRFLELIEQETPHPVDTLLIYESNPAFDLPDSRRVAKALKQVPFVVSFTSFVDETASWADLILPTPTYLEQWGDITRVSGVGWAYAAIQQPVVRPLHQTRHLGDFLIQLARGLGDATARAFPEPDFVSVLKRRYRGLFESGRGQIVSAEEPFSAASFEEFWTQLLDSGGWMEPLTYPSAPTFQTRSGRYEFHVSLESPPSQDTPADLAQLPHLEPPRFAGDPVKYPYYLIVFDTNTLFGGKGALLPLMMEMVGIRQDISWDSWVEINPATAKRWGLNEGDRVWIESEVGRVQTGVKYSPGILPEAVALPIGLGHELYGRYAQGRGVNPNRLLAVVRDPVSGMLARLATRVRLVRVGSFEV